MSSDEDDFALESPDTQHLLLQLGRLIAKEEPTSDLLDLLAFAKGSTQWNATEFQEWQHRSQLRDMLRKLASSSDEILNKLSKAPQNLTVYTALSLSVDDVWQTIAMTKTLSWFREKVEASLTKIPAGSGPQLYNPSGLMLTPSLEAAIWIACAWYEARGKLPAHSSLISWKACEQLTVLAGASREKQWGDTRSGWKRHLCEAKALLSVIHYCEEWRPTHDLRGDNRLHLKLLLRSALKAGI